MDIKEVQLHGGLFKLTLPYRWWQWLGWVIGLSWVLVDLQAW